MTAVSYDNVATTRRPAPKRKSTEAGSDPLVDTVARLLSIPLRQVYAVLWRIGLIEVSV
jgi:hypothetical protein